MMKNRFLSLLFSLAPMALAAQDYAVATIPEPLKRGVHTVVREDDTWFEVRSLDKATIRFHRVVTILDERGKDELFFYRSTDKFNQFDDATIKVFDATGKKLRSYDLSDFTKTTNPSDLVPDGKIYYLSIPVAGYPITVSFDYTIKKNGIYSYPDFMIQGPGESVEKTSFTAKVPAELDLRYKEMNIKLTPEIDNSDKKYISYTWKAAQMPVLKYEDGSGSIRNSYPWIALSPNRFELDGYPGDMTTWKNLGLWYNQLVKTDNTLSPAFRNEIVQMTAGATTDKEKARIIYEFLQKNFRYVSIQLGIGGLKPFAADFVHKKKYGDCKGLSNYMQACLSAVNIKSYSAWVWGNRLPNNIDPAFPKDAFNHQILCIPFAKDSVWLECTSNTNDFGILGSFTENRYALLLTEEGGILVKTPASAATENHYESFSSVQLNEDGSGKAAAKVNSTGEFRQEFIYAAMGKRDDQKNFIVKDLEFQQPDEFTFNFDKNKPGHPAEIGLQIEKIPDFTAGSKFFLNPRLYKIWSSPLPRTEMRKHEFYLSYPQVKKDTTVYQLPEGFVLETLPKGKSVSCDYGKFTTSYAWDADRRTITSIAELRVDAYRIPSAGFVAARNFFNEVLGEHNEKIVVKKL